MKFLLDFNKLVCYYALPPKNLWELLLLNPDFYLGPGRAAGFYHGVIVLLSITQLQSISMHIGVCRDFTSIKYSTFMKEAFL